MPEINNRGQGEQTPKKLALCCRLFSGSRKQIAALSLLLIGDFFFCPVHSLHDCTVYLVGVKWNKIKGLFFQFISMNSSRAVLWLLQKVTSAIGDIFFDYKREVTGVKILDMIFCCCSLFTYLSLFPLSLVTLCTLTRISAGADSQCVLPLSIEVTPLSVFYSVPGEEATLFLWGFSKTDNKAYSKNGVYKWILELFVSLLMDNLCFVLTVENGNTWIEERWIIDPQTPVPGRRKILP